MRKILIFVLLTLAASAVQLGVQEHLGDKVPLDLTFIKEDGSKATLKELMDGKPTILSLNYFRCSGICTPQLNDMAKMFSKLDLAENTDYKVLTISFADNEGYKLAAAKRKNILASISRPYVQDAWHFLVSDGNSSAELARRVGFNYEKKVSPAGVVEYVHPASLIVLSPEGKITRYLNGIEQLPFDVKMAVIEAAQGKVGPTIAKTLLFCFAFDPKGKTYVFKWEKIAGVVMTAIMLLFLFYLIRSSRRENPQENSSHKGETDE
jgi:protein SCO1/2